MACFSILETVSDTLTRPSFGCACKVKQARKKDVKKELKSI
ncbi:hypothetical protein GYO_2909 [Bacillus spizizenii TU-B-10]|uniref:Uncharacterized protein n=1 Tax=Bacillus spizizenii (strain DSM 15029 / JCM 12233 / NBRC 101239 / NRRL B-23049 / TU-B-10) TaxID=1052585 RepID=G4NXS6_BACS4|nr:hypothetical protein GYO_2909 [Bacillus spizizenii TU-B-10]